MNIFVLIEEGELGDSPIMASYNKNTLETKISELNSIVISEDIWNSLKRKAIEIQEKLDSEYIWDTSISEIIYDYSTREYSLDDLYKAEEVYDFNMPSNTYSIIEIPII